MRRVTSATVVIAALLAITGLPSWAAGPAEVEAVLQAWAEAYAARNGERSAALYAPDAHLWGTNSRTQAVGREGAAKYFTATAQGMRSRRVEFGEHATRIYGDTAVSSGHYTFRRIRDDGATADTPARFSITFVRQGDGRWLIVDHHSSPLPSEP